MLKKNHHSDVFTLENIREQVFLTGGPNRFPFPHIHIVLFEEDRVGGGGLGG